MLVTKTDADAGYDGFTLFIVDMDLPGVIREKKLQKMGMHASDTALLAFQDVRVPESAVLGQVGKGFYHIMWELQGERMIGAAGAVAAAQNVFDRTLQYAQERHAFGRPISKFQVTRFKFAEMATKIETARQLVYTTAWRFANGEYPVREISMAKLYASRIACEVADECIQIHGGAGYMKEYNVERVWRDLRLNRIGAGTDEVMLEVIGQVLRALSPPPFTERHEALRAEIRAFVEAELRPHADEWEAARWFPNEVFGDARRARLARAEVRPGRRLGRRRGVRRGARALRARAGWRRGSARTRASPRRRSRSSARPSSRSAGWRPRSAARRSRALAITEPDAGSDVAGVRTRARRVDGGWLVNGAKTYITNGVRADFYVTAVRTRDEPGHGSLSFLVIEKGEGVTRDASSRSSAGTPPTPARSRSTTCSSPTSTCSARRAAAST